MLRAALQWTPFVFLSTVIRLLTALDLRGNVEEMLSVAKLPLS